VINTNFTFYLAPFPSYGLLSVKFSLARGECLTLTLLLKWFPASIAINDISLFFGIHFCRRKYRCIFNHFYVMRPKSYRIQWNNANLVAMFSCAWCYVTGSMGQKCNRTQVNAVANLWLKTFPTENLERPILTAFRAHQPTWAKPESAVPRVCFFTVTPAYAPHLHNRHNQAPQYLLDLCQSVSSVASRQHLRSVSRGLLVVPRYRLSSYGRRAFSVAGPAIFNWLPVLSVWEIRPSAETPRSSVHWRRFYSQLTRVHSALEHSGRCALQMYLLTYLLTPLKWVCRVFSAVCDDTTSTWCVSCCNWPLWCMLTDLTVASHYNRYCTRVSLWE